MVVVVVVRPGDVVAIVEVVVLDNETVQVVFMESVY